MFLRTVLAVMVIAGVLLASPAQADRGGFHIRSFHTDIEIEKDSGVTVSERIVVVFTEPRRGVYRTIPTSYTDRLGYRYSLRLQVESVTDAEGRDHTTRITRPRGRTMIRIGDADRTVTGEVVYNIRYHVEDALADFTEHDELFWNATGHEWNTRIESATATVRLPADLPADSLTVAGFAGLFGSTAENIQARVTAPGVIEFRTPTELGPLQGMTVQVAWPKGHVDFPSKAARLARVLLDNFILLAPVAFFWLAWRRYRNVGRDPGGRGSVVVQYEPPADLSPAEIGALVDERVDVRDLTAGIVDLAVRGYLKVRVEEDSTLFGLIKREETVFERETGADRSTLLPHEAVILDGLFETGDVVPSKDLKEEFYRHIPSVRSKLMSHLVKAGYLDSDPRTARWKNVGLSVLYGALVFGVGMAYAAWRGGNFPVAAIVPVLAGVGTFLVTVIFTKAMPRRTPKGVDAREWALGFQEFVERVEAPRLEGADARDVFERLLPYAMALGVASKLAKRFEGIYEAAGPGWYVGPGLHRGFSTSALESNLNSSMQTATSNLVASPRSSGSGSGGGGGFSGGGGGGGGGGSW